MKTQKIKVVIQKWDYNPMNLSYGVSVQVGTNQKYTDFDVNLWQQRRAIKAFRSAGIHLTETEGRMRVTTDDIQRYIDSQLGDNEYAHKIICDMTGIYLDIDYRLNGKLVMSLKV